MTTRTVPVKGWQTFVHHSWFRSLVLILAGSFLPWLDSSSIFMWLIGGLTVLAGIGQLFSYHRWLAAITIIFSTGLLAFTIAQSSNLIVLLALMLAGWLAVNWIQGDMAIFTQALAVLLGLVCAELFLNLLFWPVNAPSQAILLTSFVFVLLELITHFDEDGFDWKKMSFSLGLSLLVVVSILVAAIWFGF
ncbi:hypothetical protein KC644_00820 [Candidatus Berkelbacteria bacterium]|nr:hypothetical protein [Candidatus Berkelbacteria bacterium]